MPSFSKTIPQYHPEAYVDEIISHSDHFYPLGYKPTRALPGDFIYLIYQNEVRARARISRIEDLSSREPTSSAIYPRWAKILVWYTGSWEIPPRSIPAKGHQSVRYLKSQGLENLDQELWQSNN